MQQKTNTLHKIHTNHTNNLALRRADFGKGRMGSALMGSLQIPCLFDRGTFGVLPLTYFDLPKSARAYLFPL